MRRRAKRLTRQQILGETAVQFIGRCFLDMGLPWHPTNAPLDAGIDGFVEIRDVQSGEATNAWIAVQSKGRTTLEKETATSFEFTCTPRDLDYWRRGNMPVLLVVSRPERNEAWWVSVKDYFRDDPGRLQSRRIVFDKQANALTAAAAGEFLLLVQAALLLVKSNGSPTRDYNCDAVVRRHDLRAMIDRRKLTGPGKAPAPVPRDGGLGRNFSAHLLQPREESDNLPEP
jgi:Domain of unknown function (DUF4365)